MRIKYREEISITVFLPVFFLFKNKFEVAQKLRLTFSVCDFGARIDILENVSIKLNCWMPGIAPNRFETLRSYASNNSVSFLNRTFVAWLQNVVRRCVICTSFPQWNYRSISHRHLCRRRCTWNWIKRCVRWARHMTNGIGGVVKCATIRQCHILWKLRLK